MKITLSYRATILLVYLGKKKNNNKLYQAEAIADHKRKT